MKIKELNIGDKFIHCDTIYEKIEYEYINCCNDANALNIETGEKVFIFNNLTVERIEEWKN